MAGITVTSEISGVVHQVAVKVGDPVAAEQTLLIVESMKMHIPVEAPSDGSVAQVLVAEGDVVAEGQSVVVLD